MFACAAFVMLAVGGPGVALADASVAIDVQNANKPVLRAIEKALTERGVAVDAAGGVTLQGKVEARPKRYRLTLKVLSADGAERGRHRFRGRSERALARNIRKQLWNRLGDAIDGDGDPAGIAAASAAPADTDDVPASANDDGDDGGDDNNGDDAPERDKTVTAADARAGDEDEPAAAQVPPARPPARAAASRPRTPPRGARSPPDLSGRPDSEEGDPGAGDAIRFRIGAGVYSRTFEYRDDLFSQLNGYELGAAALLAVRGEWYPGKHLGSRGFASLIGVGFEYETPLALDSDGVGSDAFPTRAFAWRASAMLHLPAGGWDLGVEAGYGVRSFSIDDSDSGMPRPEIPNVDYDQLVFGGHVRTPAIGGKLGIELRGGYNLVLDTGEIGSASWFPNSDAMGAFGELTLEWSLGDTVAVYGAAMFLQQGFSLNPEPGDARVAGGATDRYLSGTIGLRYAGR